MPPKSTTNPKTNGKQKPKSKKVDDDDDSLKPSFFIFPAFVAALAAWYYFTYRPTGPLFPAETALSPEITKVPVAAPVVVEEDPLDPLVFRDRTIFNVLDLPGRGKGCIAARDIKAGEMIVQEKPLVLVPADNITQDHIDEHFDKWTPRHAKALMDLSWSRIKTNDTINLDPATQSKEERYYLAEAIIQNNGVGMKTKGKVSLGVFPRMARLNHACAGEQNTAYGWREDLGELRVYALKDIKKGSELLIAYTETRKPREERRAHLHKNYGFTCTCPICSLPDEESKKMDEKLLQFVPLYSTFHGYNSDVPPVEAMNAMRDLWKLALETDYVGERGKWAQDASYAAILYADVDSARKWLELAIKFATIQTGEDSPSVANLVFTLENILDHPELGKRGQVFVGGPPE
jgi:hypothetical protein